MAIGSHQSAAMLNDEWLTPPYIIEALGEFDLDPCSPINRPWNTAEKHYTIIDDGLSKEWHGRVWCNPPYGLEAAKWLKKLAVSKWKVFHLLTIIRIKCGKRADICKEIRTIRVP